MPNSQSAGADYAEGVDAYDADTLAICPFAIANIFLLFILPLLGIILLPVLFIMVLLYCCFRKRREGQPGESTCHSLCPCCWKPRHRRFDIATSPLPQSQAQELTEWNITNLTPASAPHWQPPPAYSEFGSDFPVAPVDQAPASEAEQVHVEESDLTNPPSYAELFESETPQAPEVTVITAPE